MVGGITITGRLISGRTYFKELEEATQNNVAGAGDDEGQREFWEDVADAYREFGQNSAERPATDPILLTALVTVSLIHRRSRR
jgi:hypothetical protein